MLEYGKIIHVYYKESSSKKECLIAERFNERFELVEGFGCSDCKCKSHLFFNKEKEIDEITQRLNLRLLNKTNYI